MSFITQYRLQAGVMVYLLHRYFKGYFGEKITKDKLSLVLSKGTGELKDINLDVRAVNEFIEDANLPVEFVEFSIKKINFVIPWRLVFGAVGSNAIEVNLEGLRVTFRPKERCDTATSMFESMLESMSSSIQIATEYAMEQNTKDSMTQEKIRFFSTTVDLVNTALKVTLTDTVIQYEHIPKDSLTGVGLVLKFDWIQFCDEAAKDFAKNKESDKSEQDNQKKYVGRAMTTKLVSFKNVTISTVEFSSKERDPPPPPPSTDNEDYESNVMKADFELDGEKEWSKEEKVEEKKAKEEPKAFPRHVVQFASLPGLQQIRFSYKGPDSNVSGPKYSINITLSSLAVFISPRQLHLLVELAKVFSSSGGMETKSDHSPGPKCVSKPMDASDYRRVQEDFQQQLLQNTNSYGLKGANGWSTACSDESETEETFWPLDNSSGEMFSSAMSNYSDIMNSSVNSSSFSASTELTRLSKRRSSTADSDPTAEISHIEMKLATLAVVMIHEDLLMPSVDSDKVLIESSVEQMRQLSDRFFEETGSVVITDNAKKNFENVRVAIDKACSLNHLRLLAATVLIEGDEKRASSDLSTVGKWTCALLELSEHLSGPVTGRMETVPLVRFVGIDPDYSDDSSCFKLSFKHVERSTRYSSRKSGGPKSEFSLLLARCDIELDITIIDRISALLNPPDLFVIEKTNQQSNRGTATADAALSYLMTVTAEEPKVEVKVTCPQLTVKLRFPIPDFRPANIKTPWWSRNVRQDYLALAFSDFLLQTTFHADQRFQEYTVQTRELKVHYLEQQKSVPQLLITTQVDDLSSQTKFTVKIFPKKSNDLEDDAEPERDPMTASCYGVFEEQLNPHSGPFSSRRTVHQSDTPHSTNENDDSTELILPGEKHEIDEFIKLASACSKIQVDIVVPVISVHLSSKHLFEVLYNRINNDLLLWTPSAPKPKKTNIYDCYPNYNSLMGGYETTRDGRDIFSLCTGVKVVLSDSDSEGEDECSDMYFSTDQYRPRSSSARLIKSQGSQQKYQGQSLFTLNVRISKGSAVLNPPARDATGSVIAGQQGEFLLNLQSANVFLVSGYRGDEDLSYVCVQSPSAQLYHCDKRSIPSPARASKKIGGKNLVPLIFNSEKGILATANERGENRDMLTIAIRILENQTATCNGIVTQDAKKIQVSVGLNKCTLRHRTVEEPNSWFSQLIDFFDVTDVPIPHYVPKEVLTETQLHVWNSTIDYRPLYLPIRTAVTLGSFSIRSNQSTQTKSSTATFTFEDCALFFSDRHAPWRGILPAERVDLRRDYFSVIDFGLLEFSLKTSEKVSVDSPRLDLRISNNTINIHTCSDSAKMLLEFFTYIASNGDLTHGVDGKSDKDPSSPAAKKQEQPLIDIEQAPPIVPPPQCVINVTDKQQQYINELIYDAMQETVRVEDTRALPPHPMHASGRVASGSERSFYFPDERPPPSATKRERRSASRRELSPNPTDHPSNVQFSRDLGQVRFKSRSFDTDEEYDMVTNEPGFFPKHGDPEIKWLTTDPVHVVVNHFCAPDGKVDVLQAPQTFPNATERYSLRDMTVRWSIYGGRDFGLIDEESEAIRAGKKKRTVSFESDRRSSCSSDGDSMVNLGEQKMSIPWLAKGGVDRKHDVRMELNLNRVRFQHEVYPETTVHASRQVLAISDFCIKDRLECSQINKFLYHYTTETRPKQSRAHMLVVKALNIRPDTRVDVQECCLKVSLLPLRFNIDQDTLMFAIKFFSEVGGGMTSDNEETYIPQKSRPDHELPVLSIGGDFNDEAKKQAALKTLDDNLIMLSSVIQQEPEGASIPIPSSVPGSNSPIVFRNFEFSPEVLIRIDYHGKFDFTQGLPGILLGLTQLNNSELILKRISYRRGIVGFDKLIANVLQEFVEDISKNQLSSLLVGVGPIYSLTMLVQGIVNLILMPIRQYQKDGRIIRGIQLGANNFSESSVLALFELISRFLNLIQSTAETCYDILSPGPSVKRIAMAKAKKKKHYEPQDIREGVTHAISVVKDGFGETANTIVQVATYSKEQKGYSGAVGGVLREIPSTIFKPILVVTEATNGILGGVKNQMVPDSKREANEKWRTDYTS